MVLQGYLHALPAANQNLLLWCDLNDSREFLLLFYLNSKHALINHMKRGHVASILCFDRKINMLPIFSLQRVLSGVFSCWYSALMDDSGF